MEDKNMKGKLMLILILAVVVATAQGCAWVNSRTEIIKNLDGKVIESAYTRTVRGFSADKESAASWAYADASARLTQAQTYKGASCLAAAPRLTGILINDDRFRTYTAAIKNVSGLVIATFLLRPGENHEYTLPAYGDYTITWYWTGGFRDSTVESNPYKTAYADGKEWGWYSRISRY